MPSPPKRPDLGEVLKAPARYAVRSKQSLRDGLMDARVARLEAPHPSEHARRFLYGFTAPLTFLRLSWRHPSTKRLMVRCLTAPLLCVSLATSIGVVWAVAGISDARVEETKKERSFHLAFGDDDHDTARRAKRASKAAADKSRGKEAEDEGDDEDDDADEAAGKAVVAEVDKELHEVDLRNPESVKNAAEKIRLKAIEVAPPQRRQQPPAAAEAAQPSLHAPPPDRFSVIRTALDILESRIVQVFAALGIIEWILVWIGREHHDQIAYEVSVLAGVPGEPLAAPPRLRLDFGWLWLKLWRTVRFLLFVALVTPFAWLLGKIPHAGAPLAVGVELVWAAYWSCVFAIANTFLAWEPLHPGAAPWFIRVLRPISRIPIVGLPARVYEWALTVATQTVWPACVAFEATTWESAGLASARVIASAPFLYLVFRPMFTPAATHAYVARRPVSPSPEAHVAASSAPGPVAQG